MLRACLSPTLLLLVTLVVHGQSPTITGYEYWFNQNDTSRVFVPVAPAQVVNLNNVPLNTSSLPNGSHVACLRLKDQGPGGVVRWSSVVCRSFTKHHGGPWQIVAVRYWVGEPANDTDPSIRTKEFDIPQTVLTYNGLLDLCDFPTGSQTLKLQLLDNHGQWSSVVTRSVNIQPAGVLGLPVISASQGAFCPGDVVTLTATPPSGPGFATPGEYEWTIPSGNGWSHVPSTSNTITVTVGSTAGTVQVVAFNLCGNSPTASFAMNTPAVPGQPSAINGPAQACIGSQVTYSVSQPPGVTYAWQVSGAGWSGTGNGATFNATAGTGTGTITVTPVNACGIPGPTQQVQVPVVAPPNAGTNGSHTVCSNSEAFSLTAFLGGSPQPGGTWSGPSPVQGGQFDPATMNAGVYTYTVAGTPPCPSANATVTVNVNNLPNAGTNGTLSMCSNGAPQSLFAQLGGSPQAGGTWSGPSPVTGGQFNPGTMAAGVYTYTVAGAPPCPSASASVTVSVTAAPNAGSNGALSVCVAGSPESLFAQLGGSPQAGGTWSGPSPVQEGLFDPATMIAGVYTYTVAGTSPCPDASASVTVSEFDPPVITGVSIPATALVNEVVSFLIQQVPGATYLWSTPPGWTTIGSDTLPIVQYTVGGAWDTIAVCCTVTVATCPPVDTCFSVIVNGEVGIQDQRASAGIVVYPNPSSGVFTIEHQGERSLGAELMVLDALGRVVVKPSSLNGTDRFIIDLEGEASGVYFLRLTTPEGVFMRELVIQR